MPSSYEIVLDAFSKLNERERNLSDEQLGHMLARPVGQALERQGQAPLTAHALASRYLPTTRAQYAQAQAQAQAAWDRSQAAAAVYYPVQGQQQAQRPAGNFYPRSDYDQSVLNRFTSQPKTGPRQ